MERLHDVDTPLKDIVGWIVFSAFVILLLWAGSRKLACPKCGKAQKARLIATKFCMYCGTNLQVTPSVPKRSDVFSTIGATIGVGLLLVGLLLFYLGCAFLVIWLIVVMVKYAIKLS